MNPDLVKLAVAGIVGAHGIGHVMGWLPALGIARIEGGSIRSWLLTDLIGDGVSRAVCGAIWLAPTIGFVVAAGGLFGDTTWWRPVAVASAIVSVVAIALFWEALPVFSRVGALAVNLAVVAAVANQWSPA
jgi:hypothetical protein